MEYIYNKNGKIEHGCGQEIPEGGITVINWRGIPGEPWSWYKNGQRISDEELVELGLREDYRGTYYDKNKIEYEITTFDSRPEESWTKEKWNHLTDELNTKSGHWNENVAVKAKYELSILRSKRASEFAIFDKYQLPLVWEQLSPEQKAEYVNWRQAWLIAPELREEPSRPDWFK